MDDSTLRSASHVVHSAITLPLRWNLIETGNKTPIKYLLPERYFYNFFTNSWLAAAGLKGKNLHPQSIKILKNYWDYLIAIDKYIDNPANRATPLSGLRNEQIRSARKRFFDSLSPLDARIKKRISGVFSESTDTMADAIANRNGGINNLDDAMNLVSNTSAVMTSSAVAMLNIIHGLPERKARKIENAYAAYAMANQFQDDLYDLKRDKKTNNIENGIYQVLRQYPKELEQVGRILQNCKKVDYGILQKHAPQTAAKVRDLRRGYLSQIPPSREFDYLRSLERLRE